MDSGKVSMWRKDLQDLPELGRCAAAEFLGTAVLVWIATSSCAQFTDNGSTVQTALMVAFVVSTLILTLGHVSGCHINPAVTVAFSVLGKVSWVRALVYTNCQYAGGIASAALYKVNKKGCRDMGAPKPSQAIIHSRCGALMNLVVTPEAFQGVGLCATRVDEDKGVTWWQALIVEAILTFVLILVILAVTHKPIPGGSGPLVIGLAVAGDFLMGIQYSGASLNPARSLGPAVLSGYFVYHMIYWTGPPLGAVLAAVVWKFILSP